MNYFLSSNSWTYTQDRGMYFESHCQEALAWAGGAQKELGMTFHTLIKQSRVRRLEASLPAGKLS